MQKKTPGSDGLWSVPVRPEDLPESGRHFNLDADETIRGPIARAGGLIELSRLQAHLDVEPQGRTGLRVRGSVSATVVQACVVTLEPVVNEVAEDVDVTFVPETAETARPPAEKDADIDLETADPPELLENGAADLGALTIEFLLLGLDPYPRKEGVAFAPAEPADAKENPFAVLAALKKPAPAKE
jgi:uncharacterized metal-binding protein YceD (DUF177 family)